MALIVNDPASQAYLDQLEKAVEFCWETQRKFCEAKFYAWGAIRECALLQSRTQLWRRFPRLVRTNAHQKFMEQLNDELAKSPEQRNPAHPVWINEQFGYGNPGS